MLWKDKKVVSTLSNYENHIVTNKKSKYLPEVVLQYNKYMTGVDKFDQSITY